MGMVELTNTRRHVFCLFVLGPFDCLFSRSTFSSDGGFRYIGQYFHWAIVDVVNAAILFFLPMILAEAA